LEQPPATPRRARAWERWAPLAGVAAVVLWVIGILFDPGIPDLFVATGQEWLTFVSGNEGGILTSRLLLLIGDFLFMLFLGTLRTRLFAAEAEPRHWTAIAFGGGIATAAMLIATSTPVLAAAAAADGLEPSAAQALGVVEYAFFVGAEIAGAVLLVATGMLAIRTAVLPTWLGWASQVVALLMLIVIGPIGFIAIVIGLPLWVLVVSILLWRRGEPVVLIRQASSPAPPSSA
jgi:hypothetical protein